MKLRLFFTTALVVVSAHAFAAEPVDFNKQIKPILELSCVKCHGGEKPKGKLSLETKAEALKGGNNGTALVPGNPLESPMYKSTTLPADHDDVMPPPKEGKLPNAQIDL